MITRCEVLARGVPCDAQLPCSRHPEPGATFDAETLRIAGVAPDLIPGLLSWDRAVLMRLAVRSAMRTAALGAASGGTT